MAALAASLLVVVPAGSAADDELIKLSWETPNPGQDISWVEISPDGQHVVFLADRDGDGDDDLWSVPIGGGPILQLNDSGVAGSTIDGFLIDPTSTRVVYRGDLKKLDSDEVFSAPIDAEGGEVRLSHPPLFDNYAVNHYQVTPDGSAVVYDGNLTSKQATTLYSAPIDASGGQVALSSSLGNSDADVFEVHVTSDSSRVVYTADMAEIDRREVFSAPIGQAGQQIQLSSTGASTNTATNLRLTPDGRTAVYLVGDFVQKIPRTAPVDVSGEQEAIGGAIPEDGTFRVLSVTPDGSNMLFQLRESGADPFQLYSTSFATPDERVRLSTTTTGENVSGVTITPDSARVVYGGNLTGPDVRLYSALVGVAGGQQVLTSSDAIASIFATQVSPDSSRFIFQAAPSGGSFQLFSVPVSGEHSESQISDPDLDEAYDVFRISPDSRRVVYRGTRDGVVRILSVPLEGGPSTFVTDMPVAGGGPGEQFRITHDGTRVVFSGDIEVDGRQELWVTNRGQLVPRPVSGLAAHDVTATSAVVEWAPGNPLEQVTSYTWTLDPPANAAPARRPAATTSDTSVALGGLTPGTRYVATVTAINEAGASTSAEVAFTTTAPGGVHRLSGDDRFETAVAVALDRFDPADVDTVYLAVGSNFPDALTGGPLAAQDGAPILLVRTESLPEVVGSALGTLGPSRVVAFGGTAAISDAVLAAAGAAAGAGVATDRIAGLNRYETAAAIAAALDTTGVTSAFLATGANFPDALAGGPATGGAPILLASSSGLPDATAGALAALGPDVVVGLGGAAAVSDETLAAAAAAAGGGAGTDRLFGPDRFTTATQIAGTLSGVDTAYVAVGTNFPDALAAGSAAFGEGAPIVLTRTDALPETTTAYLDGIVGLRRIVVLGGAGAVAPDVAATLESLLDT